MNIEKLKYYIDLYENRNFTHAAKKNYTSQATISQYISKLERDLDVQLFDRSTKPIQPTREGVYFYEQSKMLYHQYGVIKKRFVEMKRTDVEIIRIAYAYSHDLRFLIPLIHFLEAENIKIDLKKYELEYLEQALLNGECDFSVSISSRFKDQQIKKLDLQKGHFSALVPRGHDLFERKELSFKEIAQYPLLLERDDLFKDELEKSGGLHEASKIVESFEEGIFYIISDKLIGFTSSSGKLAQSDSIVNRIPIKDKQMDFSVVLAYLENGDKKLLERITDVLGLTIPDNKSGGGTFFRSKTE